MLSAYHDATYIVASKQALSTICEADASDFVRHDHGMLSHDDLLAELRRLIDAGKTTNAELGRLLKLPSSRIADIFALNRPPRKITLDEAKVLVERFGLDGRSADFPSSGVLNATFVVMLNLLGIDPNKDGRAQRLAERFPTTVRGIEALHAEGVSENELIPAALALDRAEDRRSS